MNGNNKINNKALNQLIQLWFSVHQRESFKFGLLAQKLDNSGVPFTIQNQVSEDASNTRNKKQIDTFEVKSRVEQITKNFYKDV